MDSQKSSPSVRPKTTPRCKPLTLMPVHGWPSAELPNSSGAFAISSRSSKLMRGEIVAREQEHRIGRRSRRQPHKGHLRERGFARGSAAAHFDDEDAARIEMAGCRLDDCAHDVESIVTAG